MQPCQAVGRDDVHWDRHRAYFGAAAAVLVAVHPISEVYI